MRGALPGFILLSFFFSCTPLAPVNHQENLPPSPPPVSETSAEAPSSPSTPETVSVAEHLFLRDTVSGEVKSLSAITGGKPAVIDLSASWCAPCAELPGRLDAIRERLGQTSAIEFIMVLQKGDAPERLPAPPQYPVYLLEKAPPSLDIAPPPLFPTVVILDANGNMHSLLAGLYPSLVYYSAISEVLTGK